MAQRHCKSLASQDLKPLTCIASNDAKITMLHAIF